MSKAIIATVMPVVCGSFLLIVGPALAQPADRTLLSTFCDAADIAGSTCKRAKRYPDAKGRACDVKLTKGRYGGKFVESGHPLLVVTYMSDCEPHATNFGGAVVFEQSGGRYKFNSFQPGSQANECVVLARSEGNDILVCLTGFMGQGHIEGGVAQMAFTRKPGGAIDISSDLLMTSEDSSADYGANVVTCTEPNKNFGISKLAAGPRPETVTVEVAYADADITETACGKGFPKPKDVTGELSPGHAYVPDGYEKNARFTIDIASHKVTGPN